MKGKNPKDNNPIQAFGRNQKALEKMALIR
jgi:hypothetical protein